MNELIQIFTENLLSRLIASPYSSVLLEAKNNFGQNVQPELCVALLAILCAFLINYYLGRGLGRFEKHFDAKTKALFTKARHIFAGRGRIVLLLAFLPFGNLLLLSAGVLGVSGKKVAPLIFIAAGLALVDFVI